MSKHTMPSEGEAGRGREDAVAAVVYVLCGCLSSLVLLDEAWAAACLLESARALASKPHVTSVHHTALYKL
jgi:hypothetical protein